VRRGGSQEENAVWSSLQLGIEDERTLALFDQLVAWRRPNGGWNCDKRPAACSSPFQETAIPLRALRAFGLRYQHTGVLEAAARAAELLLSWRLFWRRGDGALIRLD
jgi:hypothetical protein